MNLNSLIRFHTEQRIQQDGITITNTTTGTTFPALLSAPEQGASFMLDETETSAEIQGVILLENTPEHGDILLIDNQKYIVHNIQKRLTAKVARFYANLKIH